MSDEEHPDAADSSSSSSGSSPPPPTAAAAASSSTAPPISNTKVLSAIESLSHIIPTTTLPASLSACSNPAQALNDQHLSTQISSLLCHPGSGAGDNNLCRWLYDTFQSSDPYLQLVVLRYIPTIAGVYLCRDAKRKPQAGFEAVLLALYAHETTSRNGQAVTMNVPDLSHPSLYHETKTTSKNNSTCLNLAVVSPSLEPHGTVRSTRRARIVGVALELYFSRISHMPNSSKLEFCEFCTIWSGKIDPEDKKMAHEENEGGSEFRRIHLAWELIQPMLRILGHCLLGPNKDKELFEASMRACRSLYLRALHDMDAKGILATESLLKLGKMSIDEEHEQVDHTEMPNSNVISL
ncbi:unnamed protein product [Rhodiola kirilowii]